MQDGQGGRFGDGVRLAGVGELGGLRAVGGESGDDFGHVDVGDGGVLGDDTGGETGGGDGGSETHVGSVGMEWVVL